MLENLPELEQLTITDLRHPGPVPDVKSRSFGSPKIKGEFLKGPIPLSWLTRAAELPGKSPLATALAIMFEVGRRRSQQVTLTSAVLKRFHVNRKAKYRALEKLEGASLISVVRRSRRNPLVTVLVVDDETSSLRSKDE